MRVRHPRLDESGFTLPELLVTMTITAIIGLVVSQTFLLTLKLGPETTARNRFASDASFFVDTLSDDVANSLSPATAVAPYPNCEAIDVNGTARVTYLGTFALPSGQARYRVTIDKPPNWTAAPYSSVWAVTIAREFTPTSGSMTATNVLRGYCYRFPDSRYANIITASTPGDGYTVDIRLMSAPLEGERTVSFRGDRRTLTPPT